jgi:NAD(P)-dependent dehydrogenase (short-subunit alcohol dehydrogenase family)
MKMTAPSKSELTSATGFYTMNVVNSTLFSVLCGIYTVVALVYCLVFGAPQENQCHPVKKSATTCTSTRSQDRPRTAIITGSNTGIGFASARQLVLNHNVDVVLACRSRDKATKAAETINAEAKSLGVPTRANFLHPCELSSFESVRQFSKVFHEKHNALDILVCNAGVNNTTEGRTIDDLEPIFQSNMLGHFLLTKLMFDLFPESGEGRIVTLSSVAHHFVDSGASLDESFWHGLAKLDSSSSSFLPSYFRAVFEDCMQSYPPSKLATLLFSTELNRRFGSNGKKRVRAFAVNPGAVGKWQVGWW